MIYRLTFLLTFLIMMSCSEPVLTPHVAEEPKGKPEVVQTPVPEKPPEYKGITLDQIFQPTAVSSSLDANGRENQQRIAVDDYFIQVHDYVPRTLDKSDRTIFTFRRRQPNGYWGTVVGISHLRGAGKKEIWVAVSGPGGVCCTNYSIVDISSGAPRSIFHSEDFGSFRNPMEIFDADGDGVYELVQFDSCMRYLLDDCGSCSPEPRVHFKYDKARGRYEPAPGIEQDFVKETRQATENWITEKFKEWTETKDPQVRSDLDRSLRAYVSELLHLGEERRAWRLLDRYGDDENETVVKEMRERLASCKFYQALRKSALDHR